MQRLCMPGCCCGKIESRSAFAGSTHRSSTAAKASTAARAQFTALTTWQSQCVKALCHASKAQSVLLAVHACRCCTWTHQSTRTLERLCSQEAPDLLVRKLALFGPLRVANVCVALATHACGACSAAVHALSAALQVATTERTLSYRQLVQLLLMAVLSQAAPSFLFI